MLIEALLDKWKNDRLTPEEKRLLLRQLESEEGEKAFAELWGREWEQSDASDMSERALELKLEQVRQQIKAQIPFEPETEARQTAIRPLLGWSLAAAAAVALLIVGIWLGNEKTKPGSEAVSEQLASTRTTEAVQRGERSRRLLLPDGSEIWLNVDSRLSFLSEFSDTLREVWLEGEASFEIAHDSLRPFIVHAGGIQTEVLGTHFFVSAYHKEPLSVTLARGRVKVSDIKGREVVLTANQQVIADTLASRWAVRNVDAATFGRWREGLLDYADVPLGQLEERLERWYNIRISFKDEESKKCRISGKPTYRSIWDLLSSFQFIHGIRYEVNDAGEIVISGGNCT